MRTSTTAIHSRDRDFERLLRPSEVTALLGVSRSWLYEAAKDGRIPSVRLGGKGGPLRFVETDVMAWLSRAREGWSPSESSTATTRRAAETS